MADSITIGCYALLCTQLRIGNWIMSKQTEQIDKLYLELSQFTSATTKKEIDLAKAMKNLMLNCPAELQKNAEFLEAWDSCVILLDCSPIGCGLTQA
jgi:hypothetical protein